jgi:hypothetical protein
MNVTSKNVMWSGICDAKVGNASAQKLSITFNQGMTVTFTFMENKASLAGMLGADQSYSVSDIEFSYLITEEFFPNAKNPSKCVFTFLA